MHERVFIFNGKKHYIGTIVKINECYIQQFNFNSKLKFIGCVVEKNSYRFTSLYNAFDAYEISVDDVTKYINEVIYDVETVQNENTIKPEYIEGIVSAWILYVASIFFSFAFKEVTDTLMACALSTIIFFSWRNKKIKGE